MIGMVYKYPLKNIESNPWQGRIGEPDVEYIEELAADIAANGLLQIPVGRDVLGRIQLAFGHNRLAAYRLLNKDSGSGPIDYSEMPVDVRKLSDEQMAALAWSENERRRDLNPIERALAIRKRIENFGWTQEQAGSRLGLAKSSVSMILKLLNLPDEIRQALATGDISERVAAALLPLYDVPAEIRNNKSLGYYYKSPAEIVRQALAGASSDAIRKEINQYFERAFKSLEKAEWKLDTLFPEGNGVYCGLCRNCDRRLASRNLCMDALCFEAKIRISRHRYLEKASLASGYDIVDQNKGGYPSELPTDKKTLERVLTTKCGNIRVAYKQSWLRDDDPRRVPGHPKAELVCDKRNNTCTCVAGLEKLTRDKMYPAASSSPTLRQFAGGRTAVGNPAEVIDERTEDTGEVIKASAMEEEASSPSPENLEDVMRKVRLDKKKAMERRDEVHGLLVDLLASSLAEDRPGAFWLLVRGYAWITEEPKLADLYREAARGMADRLMYSSYDSVGEMVDRVNKSLDGLQLPAIKLGEKTLVEVFAETAEE